MIEPQIYTALRATVAEIPSSIAMIIVHGMTAAQRKKKHPRRIGIR